MKPKMHEAAIESAGQEKTLQPYMPRSSNVRYDAHTGRLEIKIVHAREDEYGWRLIDLSEALLPASALNAFPISLKKRPEMCLLIVAAVDAYVLASRNSKSTDVLASDMVRTYCKLFEYSWLNGFYRPSDMPRAAWNSLCHKLINGGWVNALEIPDRTAKLLATPELNPENFLSVAHNSTINQRSVLAIFQKKLGTNIASRELNIPRLMIEQSIKSKKKRETSDSKKYQLPEMKTASATTLNQITRAFNRLSDIEGIDGLRFVPVPNAHDFSNKYGRKSERTDNITPEIAARLLTHSFDWIMDKSGVIVDLIEALERDLSIIYTSDQFNHLTEATKKVHISNRRTEILDKCPERAIAEKSIGAPILRYTTKKSRDETTSVYSVLNELYSSCFIVIALMNARRKDEIVHKAIGLHELGVREVDMELELFMCEFFIEKTVNDYNWFWITAICKKALDILIRISKIAWRWAEIVGGKPLPTGRDRKLFVYPAFASDQRGGMLYFDFNTNPTGMSCEFLKSALKELYGDFRVTPHMFRRGYGLIHHYIYENTDLASLARKYRHLDLVTPLHYVTNGTETPAGAHAAALWSAPSQTVLDAHRKQAKLMEEEIKAVGLEKIHQFVEDIVAGEKRYAGGFAKLVERFNRHLSSHVSYDKLSLDKKSKLLSQALIDRGHMPHPYPHTTCMAGTTRRGAACSTEGVLARERAGPIVCGGCTYSATVPAHLLAIEDEVKSLEAANREQPGTLRGDQAVINLDSLRRILVLQKRRLGIDDGKDC